MRFLVALCVLLLSVSSAWSEKEAEVGDLRLLVKRCLPGCKVQIKEGEVTALQPTKGDPLTLKVASKDHPMPKKDVYGYWFSPAMTFLAEQMPKVKNPKEAVAVVQLLHSLSQGQAFVQEKLYEAKAIKGGWIVIVDHDFAKKRTSVQQLPPYELLLGEDEKVTRFTQRSWQYLGSAKVYSETIRTVYEREVKRNGGLNYTEVLERELREAWGREKNQKVKPEAGEEEPE